MFDHEDKIILCDVDGVVVQGMHAEWLRRYNRDYHDNLTPSDITEWDMAKFVKPKCGKKIYDYLWDADLYDNLYIDESIIWGVSELQAMPNTQVIFVSAGVGGAVGKYNILNRHGLILNSESEFVSIRNKGLLFGDAMIDDYQENLYAFQRRNPRGISLLFDAYHNQDVDMTRVYNWADVVNFFKTGVLF
jgi:5'-nucleotidase